VARLLVRESLRISHERRAQSKSASARPLKCWRNSKRPSGTESGKWELTWADLDARADELIAELDRSSTRDDLPGGGRARF